jgi:hypothetical protein
MIAVEDPQASPAVVVLGEGHAPVVAVLFA